MIRTILTFLVTTTIAVNVSAQEKGPAFTEPPKDDWSYELMGEFVGSIAVDGNEQEPLGIQIRPLGDSEFQAVAFMGGLPGQEQHEPKRTRMIGRLSGQFLILSGGPWAVFVEKDHCKVIDREGKQVGRLNRIKRSSPTLGALPPEDATVIFDGTSVDQFSTAQMTKDGLLMAGSNFKPMFQDFNLHVEFRLPYMPQAEGQQRCNSGLYLQSRYECQVLDSFATQKLINGCGALYQFKKPELNMCFPPLVWQTYDVQFTAPRWAADRSKIRNARISLWINGVNVQDDVELLNKTGAGKPEEPKLLPIKLQDHGAPVLFRNIWIVDRGLSQMKNFPVMAPKGGSIAMPKKAAEKKASANKSADAKADPKKSEASQADKEKLAPEKKKSPEPKREARKQAKGKQQADAKKEGK